MTDTAPAPQQPMPTLPELLQHLPDDGQVYVNLALERWTNTVLRQVHATQLAEAQRHVVALQSALLAAGIDPNSLQPKGTPELGTDTEAPAPGTALAATVPKPSEDPAGGDD